MKKYIYTLLATLFVPYLLTSCSKDDDNEVEASENCIITSFTLGQLRRSMYLKTVAGMDSIYTTSFSGASFPLTINQLEQTIENLDSLPARTRLDKVLTTVKFDGALFWRKAKLAEDEDTTWTTYSSKDSLDLSQPLHFLVLSATGLSSRIYTLKINVHQQRSDSTQWNALPQTSALDGVAERRATICNDKLMVIGKNAAGATILAERPATLAGDWATHPTTGAENAVPSTLQNRDGKLFMSTTTGIVITSTDGMTWTPTADDKMDGLVLVAASPDRLYAMANGGIYSNSSLGWVEEACDDDKANLPTGELNSVYYRISNRQQRLMLIGSRNATDPTATIWSKTWDDGEEGMEKWIYYTPNQTDKYRCPMLKNLNIVRYDNGLQALGGRSRDGRYEAMDSIFHSSDNGVTWKTYINNDMNVDSELRTQAQMAQYISATVDDDQYLWLIIDSNVWRGRINRLGFLRSDRD